MTIQQDYLAELKRQLKALPTHEVQEILQDYQEHFAQAIKQGQSEEEICKKLGKPQIIAQAFLTSNSIDNIKNDSSTEGMMRTLLRSLATFLVLAPFNFLFFIGPLLTLFFLIIVGWGTDIGLAIGASLIYWAHLFVETEIQLPISTHFSIFFMWLGIIGFCGVLGSLMTLFTKYSFKIILSYINWNINLVLSKSKGGLA